jgi:hypothetical protein
MAHLSVASRRHKPASHFGSLLRRGPRKCDTQWPSHMRRDATTCDGVTGEGTANWRKPSAADLRETFPEVAAPQAPRHVHRQFTRQSGGVFPSSPVEPSRGPFSISVCESRGALEAD